MCLVLQMDFFAHHRWREGVLNAIDDEDGDQDVDDDGDDSAESAGEEDADAPHRGRFGRRQDPLCFADFDDDEEFKGLFG